MKKLFCVLIVIILVVSLTACDNESEINITETSTSDAIVSIIIDDNTIGIEDKFSVSMDGTSYNVCINEYNRDFRDLYVEDSYKMFFDYENSFLPFVEIENQYDENNIFYRIKAYDRKTYSKDGELLAENYVNRTLHTFCIDYQNLMSESITIRRLPKLVVVFKDENGNEFFDENKYVNINDEVEFSLDPVYIEPSDNVDSADYSNYAKITLDSNESKALTLKFVLDNDLYTKAYLCFESEDGNKYYKLYMG